MRPLPCARSRPVMPRTGSRRSPPMPSARLFAALLLLAGPVLAQEDALPAPLTGTPGDAARGRAIVADRQRGLCLLCHTGPFPEERFQGNLAPDLSGAGSRWSEAQLRLRLVDSRRLNPDSIMPSYYRTEGLNRVGSAFRGRTVLSAQEIEDVLAYLLTLRDGDSR
ncbi:sulfur oxidation c-type cytochrome SoxX [Roseomonas hellenica]|uniref:Sulfur oxidation c-type cytochrome SoxX n=2 Tax=Plastoroseomonas hellenica TaxID=2687306 RepID=A0ABS5F4E8_9PROT|nr:sulfur oxidation c-type cytochrome SoxX [Plastoroseomonas hellenica]